ncbi:Replication factor A protein 1 [Agyrium rufum]|nr:Replication factor A protein 1 [Agyrium rufum]
MAADPRNKIDVGSLRAILTPEDGEKPTITQPIVQCVQIKALPAHAEVPDRYRVVFNDSVHFIQTMLATQINAIAQSGSLRKGCLVRLKTFSSNYVQKKGKLIIIILDLEVLEELGVHDKIGEPKQLEQRESTESKPRPTTLSTNDFYGDKHHEPQQPAQHAPQKSIKAQPSSTSHANVYPIESLSPYGNKWTIKARCTNKSDIKTWHNRNGEGKLFSVNLLDESGEIKATGFNDQCDTYYDLFQEGNVYYISTPCRVQMAKKQFSNLNHEYEITFERDTLIEKAEAQEDVPQIRFNFTNIADLQNVEKDAVIDTIGILKDVGETTEIVSKTTSKPYSKRELTLVDSTNFSVRLTIWGNSATTFDIAPESVVAFKGVKVSDFGGRSLSLLSSGTMSVEPDINEAHKLKGWYEVQGRNDTFSSHAGIGASMGAAGGRPDKLKTLAQVKDENLGMSENPDYFDVKATILYVKQDNAVYPACMSEGCNKKVVEVDEGKWRCERCDKEHPKPEWRYIMQLNVSDHTGHIYLSCFDDTGRKIMGMSANDLMDLKEADEKAYAETFQEANCQTLIFNCRAKMDSYQDQQRVRYQVTGARNLNWGQECTKLANLIKMYDMNA